MRLVRLISGVAALLLLVFCLNVMLLSEEPFAAIAWGPLAGAFAGGLVWLVLTVVLALLQAREGRSLRGVYSVVGTVLFAGICLVLYAFANYGNLSWDLTREGRTELSMQTQKVLRGLDQEVKVTCFFTVSGDRMMDIVRDKTRRFLERCQEYTPLLDVEFVDPQQSPDRVEALEVKRLSPSGTVVVTAGRRKREIPLSDVTERLEERQFTNALINVIRDSLPTVGFLVGHGERRITDDDPREGGSGLAAWLRMESYEVREVTIQLGNPTVPQDCDVLVINGPKGDLSPVEVAAIEEFLATGGRLLVMLDPWIIQNQGEGAVETMRPWLERRYGIVVGDDIILSTLKQEGRGVVDLVPDFSMLREYGFELDPAQPHRGSYSPNHPITRVFDKVMAFPAARSVTLRNEMPDGVVGDEILRTMPNTWVETDIYSFYANRQATMDPDETRGPVGVGVAVLAEAEVKARDTRIVVIGDSDFASNETIHYSGHHNFLLNCLAWLCESEQLIAIRPTGEEDPAIILTKGERQAVAWLASLGVVQLVALAGIVSWLMRRRHQ